MQNDLLYFKYKIENKSDSTVVLYGTDRISIKVEGEDEFLKEDHATAWPRLSAVIIGSDKKFPLWGSSLAYIPPDVIIYEKKGNDNVINRSSLAKKRIILPPHESVVREYGLTFNDTTFLYTSVGKLAYSTRNYYLTNGINTLQLEYFSGEAFREKFKREKQKDIRLKNSIMFEGRVKSNICYFTYPKNDTPLWFYYFNQNEWMVPKGWGNVSK